MEIDLPPMSAVIYRCVKKFPPRRTRAAGPAQKKSAGSAPAKMCIRDSQEGFSTALSKSPVQQGLCLRRAGPPRTAPYTYS